jgi:transposase/uncharacterized protein YxjI
MYSNDVRNIAVRLYNSINSFRKVAIIIGSSHSSIHRWLNVLYKPRKIQNKKLNNSKILDTIILFIKTHPFCSVKDVNNILLKTYNISVSNELVRLTIKKTCNFSKKRARYFSQPKNEQEKLNNFLKKRTEFLNENRKFVSIDETSFGRNFNPSIGYAIKGQRLNIKRPTARITTRTVLTVISQNHHVIYQEKIGSFNTESFCEFLNNLPYPEKTVFLLDNVRFHHSKQVKNLAINKGWDLLYTPPYSPVFNPIEGVFSIVKRNYYKFMNIQKAFACVNDLHIKSFFHHSFSATCKFEN